MLDRPTWLMADISFNTNKARVLDEESTVSNISEFRCDNGVNIINKLPETSYSLCH